MSPKTTIVKIADLKLTLFVRAALDQDRALQFADQMEHGKKFPPITITKDLVVVDGRHRLEAHEVLMRTEIEATIVEVTDETDLITKAFQANLGGSLPPTQDDIEHTIMLLLDRNVPIKQIGERLNLPATLAKRYIGEVRSKAARAQMQKAADSITESGLNIPQAAEKFGVDPAKLKEMISGRHRKHKNGVAEIQRGLTSSYKSIGIKNASLLRSLISKYGDGEVSEKQMNDIFDHLNQLQKRSARVIDDWRKRFQAASSESLAA